MGGGGRAEGVLGGEKGGHSRVEGRSMEGIYIVCHSIGLDATAFEGVRARDSA